MNNLLKYFNNLCFMYIKHITIDKLLHHYIIIIIGTIIYVLHLGAVTKIVEE